MTAYLSSPPRLPGTHGTHGLAHLPLGFASSLKDACRQPPGIACRLVWDATHNRTAADLTSAFLAGPLKLALRIAFVVALALVVRLLVHRVISKIAQRAADPGPAKFDAALRLRGERRFQRAQALGSLLRNIASVVIFGIAAMTIAGDVGLNLAPVLASAGVIGLAVGFGAQSLVRDFLSGIFMLLEDQYGVGDLIDAGDATGTVEAVGLRTTRLRDVNGVVWHVRNGTISRIGNQSQGWSRAVVDFPVSYGHDLGRVRALMKDAADRMWSEPRWHELILEEPEIWGVESIYSDAVVVRLVAKTLPLRQSQVARELRERVKTALDIIGVDTEPTIGAPGTAPGAGQTGTGRTDADQLEAGRTDADPPAGQAAAAQAAGGQAAAAQAGAGQTGAGQTGASQTGASRKGTSQTGTGYPGAGYWSASPPPNMAPTARWPGGSADPAAARGAAAARGRQGNSNGTDPGGDAGPGSS